MQFDRLVTELLVFNLGTVVGFITTEYFHVIYILYVRM